MSRIVNALGALVVATAIVPAVAAAGEVTTEPIIIAQAKSTTPFSLVSAAYAGNLPGIPAFSDLEAAVSFGTIDAEDLVKAGVADGRLPAETLMDRRYLRAVASILDGLINL